MYVCMYIIYILYLYCTKCILYANKLYRHVYIHIVLNIYYVYMLYRHTYIL